MQDDIVDKDGDEMWQSDEKTENNQERRRERMLKRANVLWNGLHILNI